MQASLVTLEEAIHDAKERKGTSTFTDAADAIGSGHRATQHVLEGLLEHGYAGRAVMPEVDRPAAERAPPRG